MDLNDFGDLLQDTLAKCGARRLSAAQKTVVLAAIGGAAMASPRFKQAMLDRACAAADARKARGSYTAGPRRILQFGIEAALGVRYEGPDRAEK